MGPLEFTDFEDFRRKIGPKVARSWGRNKKQLHPMNQSPGAATKTRFVWERIKARKSFFIFMPIGVFTAGKRIEKH
jgi:hypothetical protein